MSTSVAAGIDSALLVGGVPSRSTARSCSTEPVAVAHSAEFVPGERYVVHRHKLSTGVDKQRAVLEVDRQQVAVPRGSLQLLLADLEKRKEVAVVQHDLPEVLRHLPEENRRLHFSSSELLQDG